MQEVDRRQENCGLMRLPATARSLKIMVIFMKVNYGLMNVKHSNHNLVLDTYTPNQYLNVLTDFHRWQKELEFNLQIRNVRCNG